MTVSPLNHNLYETISSPIMDSRRWVDGVTFPVDLPLINVSQAAPTAPPPAPMREAMAEAILTEPEAHLYGPTLGFPALRAEVAEQWRAAYHGEIAEAEVAIT